MATTNKAFLRFVAEGTSKNGRTLRIGVYQAEHRLLVGNIQWYSLWRRYVFYPADGTLFDTECLFEIGHELRRMMDVHRAT